MNFRIYLILYIQGILLAHIMCRLVVSLILTWSDICQDVPCW